MLAENHKPQAVISFRIVCSLSSEVVYLVDSPGNHRIPLIRDQMVSHILASITSYHYYAVYTIVLVLRKRQRCRTC